jgi:hypothetical protein
VKKTHSEKKYRRDEIKEEQTQACNQFLNQWAGEAS